MLRRTLLSADILLAFEYTWDLFLSVEYRNELDAMLRLIGKADFLNVLLDTNRSQLYPVRHLPVLDIRV